MLRSVLSVLYWLIQVFDHGQACRDLGLCTPLLTCSHCQCYFCYARYQPREAQHCVPALTPLSYSTKQWWWVPNHAPSLGALNNNLLLDHRLSSLVSVNLQQLPPPPKQKILSNNNSSFNLFCAGDSFVKDGQNFTVVSGSMHYFRVVPQLWPDRLHKLRACGLNTGTICPLYTRTHHRPLPTWCIWGREGGREREREQRTCSLPFFNKLCHMTLFLCFQ